MFNPIPNALTWAISASVIGSTWHSDQRSEVVSVALVSTDWYVLMERATSVGVSEQAASPSSRSAPQTAVLGR